MSKTNRFNVEEIIMFHQKHVCYVKYDVLGGRIFFKAIDILPHGKDVENINEETLRKILS